MSNFSIENDTKILEIETHLNNNQYLSSADKPGKLDSTIFTQLNDKKVNIDQTKYPNLFAWFGWINMFNPETVKNWGTEGAKTAQKDAKKDGDKKDEKKGGDDVDLFGDDDEDEEEAKKLAEKKKAEIEGKKKEKKAVIAKTIFVFDVKVYEEDEDLDKLAAKILAEIILDGLVWNKDYKLVPVAYGIKKIQMGCVVEDDKVASDDIIEKIMVWEDQVQSVDIATMQKV